MSVASIGNGAKELLDEVATGKITGEEEAFSHTDLVDFQANLDGAKKAYDVLRPLVSDEDLLAELDAAFAAVQQQLDDAPRRRHLRVLRHRDRGAAARAGPGRRRPRRAAVAADRGGRLTVAEQRGLSRRHLIAGAGVLGAAGVAGALAVEAAADGGGPDRRRVDFHGAHQAGIATPVQGHLHFASYDVTTTDRAALVALLQDWTAAAREMTADRRVGGSGARAGWLPRRTPARRSASTPPTSPSRSASGRACSTTGSAWPRAGRSAGRPAGVPRRHARPGAVRRRPRGAGLLRRPAGRGARGAQPDPDRRRPGRGAVGPARLRQGLGHRDRRPDAAQPVRLQGRHRQHPRRRHRRAAPSTSGRDRSDGSAWMAGGSYLVARRIRMTIETWDRTSLDEQETVIGRTKDVGAPLGQARERATVRPAELPATSHVRLAHPSLHGGARLLRRGYNFVDGSDGLGHLDAGLFFLAYQRDPRRGFVPIQTELARHDAMNEYVRHTGSSLWAVPPGVGPDGWWGETLLG